MVQGPRHAGLRWEMRGTTHGTAAVQPDQHFSPWAHTGIRRRSIWPRLCLCGARVLHWIALLQRRGKPVHTAGPNHDCSFKSWETELAYKKHGWIQSWCFFLYFKHLCTYLWTEFSLLMDNFRLRVRSKNLHSHGFWVKTSLLFYSVSKIKKNQLKNYLKL